MKYMTIRVIFGVIASDLSTQIGVLASVLSTPISRPFQRVDFPNSLLLLLFLIITTLLIVDKVVVDREKESL